MAGNFVLDLWHRTLSDHMWPILDRQNSAVDGCIWHFRLHTAEAFLALGASNCRCSTRVRYSQITIKTCMKTPDIREDTLTEYCAIIRLSKSCYPVGFVKELALASQFARSYPSSTTS